MGSHRIAQAIEALGAISTAPNFKPSVNDPELCFARTCYDHLAGELGVRLAAAIEHNQVLVSAGERDYDVPLAGWEFLANWQIDASSVQQRRRAFARRCLDWTQKRDHLARKKGAKVPRKKAA